MTAGRALDALVAEKVMGWKNIKRREDTSVIRGTRPEGGASWVPLYSTDIAAALEVVEKMREQGYFADIHATRGERGMWPPYSAKFQMNTGPRFLECAESVPVAICLAALKAVGVEVKA